MTELSILREYGEELERRLRLKTFPVAVKLLEREEDIPEGAIMPGKNLGYHLLSCQGFAMSRRDGVTVAMLKDDMWCFEPAVGYGIVEPPEYFLQGHTRLPGSSDMLDAGKNWTVAFPRLNTGKYIGIVSAPLRSTNFEPDLVMIYGDSSQMTELVVSAVYKDGRDINCRFSGAAACVYAVVPVMQTGEYTIALPCRGDRTSGIAQDDEIIFSVPIAKLGDLIVAFRKRDEAGSKLPLPFKMIHEPQMPDSFVKCGRLAGLDM